MIDQKLHKNRGRNYPISFAPMMGITDKFYRYFMRQITRHTLLYTQMVTTGAILRGDRQKILDFSDEEKPLAIQLGGDEPKQLEECAKVVTDYGFDEINLNVGCPSERVQEGNFGACLMAQPDVVARAVEKMRNATHLPVTVKHRIGIENLDRYEDLANFVQTVSQAGCNRFIVHARIAVLGGLSPRQNRRVPPLRYQDVYRLKKDFPDLVIEINGHIKSMEEALPHLDFVDGVMIGRAAYENPFIFSLADSLFFNSQKQLPSRREIIETMISYIEKWNRKDENPSDDQPSPYRIIRHLLNLFSHRRGAKAWKRYLSENSHKTATPGVLLKEAMEKVPPGILDDRAVLPSAISEMAG